MCGSPKQTPWTFPLLCGTGSLGWEALSPVSWMLSLYRLQMLGDLIRRSRLKGRTN